MDFTALFSGFGKELENGSMSRVWIKYDIDDKLSYTLGIIDYQGGDNPYFESIKNNDKLFANLKYNF